MTITRRVTIREVAQLAEVSVGTASNVLNGAPHVSEPTRRRVERVIADLGFTPDTIARSLIAKRRVRVPAKTRTDDYLALLKARDLDAPDQLGIDLLTQIVDEGVLGATRHVRLAHRLILRLASEISDLAAAWKLIDTTVEFIAMTRGIDAPIVANGVAWLLAPMGTLPLADRAKILLSRAEKWQVDTARRLDQLVQAAADLLGADARLVLFDYSATVAAVIAELHRRGLRPRPIILGNRGIAGGVRYVNAFLDYGLDLQLAPEAALEYVLENASAVLLGCESVRGDGDIVNSLGTRPLVRIAHALSIPVYCCADSFKLDVRSLGSEALPPPLRSFDSLWLDSMELPERARGEGARIDTSLPAVELVPARFLSAIITEAGAVAPSAIRQLSKGLFTRDQPLHPIEPARTSA